MCLVCVWCVRASQRERDQARAELEEAQRDANNRLEEAQRDANHRLEEAQRDANHRLEEAQQAAADLEVLGIEWTCVCIQMTIVAPGLPRVPSPSVSNPSPSASPCCRPSSAPRGRRRNDC